jgi:hypothetical protein
MTPQQPTLVASAQALAQRLSPGDLDETLANVTAAAVELIPDVDYASVSVRHHDDRIETVSETDGVVLSLDEVQYSLREGPCYEAATDTSYLVATTLREDPRFPRYGPAAADLGVHAQVAFRLFERRRSQGALNLYSRRPGALADVDDVAALFRSHAAVAIAYAADATGMKTALETRSRIGAAVGVVMERYGLDEARAFAFLTRLSQQRNVKLRRVAEEFLADTGEGGRAPGTAPD